MKRLIIIITLILLPLSPIYAFQTHSVTLSWSASPDAPGNPTLTYNVYRGPAACSGGPTFSKIGSVAAGVLTFSDPNVSAGQTFAYQVTSVLNGVEGNPSNCATAVILPSSPASLSVTVN